MSRLSIVLKTFKTGNATPLSHIPTYLYNNGRIQPIGNISRTEHVRIDSGTDALALVFVRQVTASIGMLLKVPSGMDAVTDITVIAHPLSSQSLQTEVCLSCLWPTVSQDYSLQSTHCRTTLYHTVDRTKIVKN